MKSLIKRFLQNCLGFHSYLVIHSIFVALTLRFRRNEGSVLQFINRLKPDDEIIDVGANVGTMTLLFSRRCSRGRVYAFEPIPESFRAAKRVLEIFKVRNVRLFQLGAGEFNETVRMVMPNISGSNVRLEGLSHVVRPGSEATKDGTYYEVELVALDEFAAIRDKRIAAIKIDVEDHERFVIRGARRIIARDRPLIYCELWSPENKSECFSTLEDLDYTVYVEVRGKMERYDEVKHKQVNYFFIPRERLQEFGVVSLQAPQVASMMR